jgi:hypothetical protein
MSLTFYTSRDYVGEGTKYKSDITTNGESILELTVKHTNLYVSFLRSSESYNLESLLNEALCFATKLNIYEVKLEDDAIFSILRKTGEPCKHRALIQRVFEGKKGIYESKGWKPTSETSELITKIISYANNQATDIIRLLTKIQNTPPPKIPPPDNESFGRWVNAQECRVLTYYYTGLVNMSNNKWKPLIDTMSPDTKEFIHALYELRRISFTRSIMK